MRKERRDLLPFLFHACAGGSQTSLRQECAESSIHPLPPSGYSPCLRGRVSYNRKPALTNCPPETGGTRSKATEGVDSSRFCFSLRSLSRVASDYSSDSVVCFGILRPLRSLREIKIMAFCFSRRARKERRVLSPFVFHACAGGGCLSPAQSFVPFCVSRLRWRGVSFSLFAYAATGRVSNVRVCGGAYGEKSGHDSVCGWNLCGFSVDLACVFPTIRCCPPEDRPESSRFFLLGPPVSFAECSREV